MAKKNEGSDEGFDLKKFVKAGKSRFKKAAEAAKKARQQLDIGDFVCQVHSIKIGKTNKPGVEEGGEYAVINLVVAEGADEGKQGVKFYGLDDERKTEYFLRDLKTLGYDPDDFIDDPDEVVDGINNADPKLKVEVVVRANATNPDYNNIYINNLVDAEDSDTDEEDEDEEDEEEDDTDEEEDEEDEDEEDEEDEDEDEDEDDDEEEDLEAGDEVEFQHEDQTLSGEVVEVLEGEEKARVKVTTGKGTKKKEKIYRVAFSELVKLTEEDE